jgi:phosphoribosylglycinamide formyltransferase-1
MINLGILISGRGSNMTALLSAIQRHVIKNVNACIVISNKMNAPGLTIASEKFNIPTRVLLSDGLKGWNYDQQIASTLQEHGVTPRTGLICLAGFLRIVSPEFVRLYKMRIMNIHPSLLPCTVHFVDEGLDSGPIIAQKAVPVLETDTEEILSLRILRQEHNLYSKTVKLFADGKILVKGRNVLIQS